MSVFDLKETQKESDDNFSSVIKTIINESIIPSIIDFFINHDPFNKDNIGKILTKRTIDDIINSYKIEINHSLDNTLNYFDSGNGRTIFRSTAVHLYLYIIDDAKFNIIISFDKSSFDKNLFDLKTCVLSMVSKFILSFVQIYSPHAVNFVKLLRQITENGSYAITINGRGFAAYRNYKLNEYVNLIESFKKPIKRPVIRISTDLSLNGLNEKIEELLETIFTKNFIFPTIKYQYLNEIFILATKAEDKSFKITKVARIKPTDDSDNELNVKFYHDLDTHIYFIVFYDNKNKPKNIDKLAKSFVDAIMLEIFTLGEKNDRYYNKIDNLLSITDLIVLHYDYEQYIKFFNKQ